MRNRRLWMLSAGLAGVAGLAALAVLVALRPRESSRRSRLYPDASAVRYRYPITRPGQSAPAADTAIRALEARVREPSPSPVDLAELAELYLQRARTTGDKGDYERSESLARRSLELLPAPNSALLTLARLADAHHDFRGAIDLARRARSQLGSSGGLAVLASSHLALGELPQAAEAAEAAVVLRPDSAAYLMRALVMEAQGRDEEAAFDFARAARREDHGHPELSARIRALWGRFLMRRGELGGADQLAAESIRIVPAYPLALWLRGELALRRGRPGEARALFEEAFAGSRQVRYLIDEARARELAGDRLGADGLRAQVETIVRAELADGGPGHRLDLVEVLLDRGRAPGLAEATALAREEVARRPGADARYQLARALACSGRPRDALDQIAAVLATGAHEAEIYELAARLERAAGSGERGALYARLAADLDPGGSGWRSAGLCAVTSP